MVTNLLSLLQLTDTTLPIGGYAHSYGLETYVQHGIVKDKPSAQEFVVNMLQQNVQYTDAAFVSLAYDSAEQNNWEHLVKLNDECTAVKIPAEVRQASHKLGMRLVKVFETFSKGHITKQYKEAITTFLKPHYSIAFGIYAQALHINKEEALTGFYYKAAVGMITNCVKLIPLGQQDGQELLFSLQPLLKNLVQHSMQPDPDFIGMCCAGFDIRCMQHERLYSRLFMSLDVHLIITNFFKSSYKRN